MKKSKVDWKVVGLVSAVVLVLYLIGLSAIKSIPNQQSIVETQQPAQPTQSLAAAVEPTLLRNMGYDSMQELRAASGSSNIAYLNGFEDVSAGTVRAFVQKDVSKEDAQNVGKLIMATVGFDLKDLDWVVVRGTNGLDVNVSRSDVPALR